MLFRSANASTYPNGTIVINTGLLSTLHTEDELVACLAHEVAHFVLDHHLININAEIKRQKAAAAVAAFATVVAAVAEGAAAYYSNGYYMPGAVTAATAIGATAIANEIVTSLGMEYSLPHLTTVSTSASLFHHSLRIAVRSL